MVGKRTFYVKTFGCQMNYADSEKVHRILLGASFTKVLDPTKADVVILNTCSVRQKWEDRVFGFVREIRKSDRENGRKTLIGITGCMVRKTGTAKRYLGEETSRKQVRTISLLGESDTFMNWDDPLLLRSSDIDFVFRIEETGHLTKMLSVIYDENIGNDEKWEEYLRIKQVPSESGSANVIIQTGCDNFCAFCIVPYARGREISRSKDEIVAEAREAVANGAKEITLLGQNVNSYGKETKAKLWNEEEKKWVMSETTDISGERGRGLHVIPRSGSEEENIPPPRQRAQTAPCSPTFFPEASASSAQLSSEKRGSAVTTSFETWKTPFRELLDELGKIEGLDRIRFTSSNPHDMTKDILDGHFEVAATCPYLHLALQSGSDRVLKSMNRKHTYADFKAQVDYLRSRDPLFSVSTDIIVGFPGETEEDFELTKKAMEEIGFDFAYIARYSVRPGTRASDAMEDDVSPKEKARRWNALNAVLRKTVAERNALMVGRTEDVLVSGIAENGERSGRTRNFKEVFFPSDAPIGTLVRVRLTGTDGWVVRGEAV